jgi:hypothetical protein
MFFDFSRRRRNGEIARILGSLPESINRAHPVEKASILILANLILGVAARNYDSQLARYPARSARGPAIRAADGLLATYGKLVALCKVDPSARHARYIRVHGRAVALATVTVGLALDTTGRSKVVAAWASAWTGRDRAVDAVTWLRQYETEVECEMFPRKVDGAIPSDLDIVREGRTVPAFLRPRRSRTGD